MALLRPDLAQQGNVKSANRNKGTYRVCVGTTGVVGQVPVDEYIAINSIDSEVNQGLAISSGFKRELIVGFLQEDNLDI